MPYFLDGNNLIGLVRKTSRPTEEDRQALITEVAGRLRASRARAVLFFDGPADGRGASLGPLSIRVATPGRTADEAIVAAVAQARAPGECLVVTGDRGLAGKARDAGGKVCGPEEFFARFGRGATGREDRPDAGRVDVDDWMQWFNDEANRDT